MKRLLLVMFIFLFVSACKGGKSEKNEINLKGNQEIYNVQIIQSRLGKKMWKLEAMSIQGTGDTMRFYKFKLSFFGPGGQISSELIADSGKVSKKTENMEAFGNIRILFFKDSTRVYTSHITYNATRRLISGDKKVKIVTPEGVIYGTGFQSDPEMNHIKIFGQVKGHGKK